MRFFLSEVTKKPLDKVSVLLLNRILRHLENIADFCLHFPTLDENSLQLVIYFDASLKKNPDISSQLGYLILLVDKNMKFCIFQFFIKSREQLSLLVWQLRLLHFSMLAIIILSLTMIYKYFQGELIRL